MKLLSLNLGRPEPVEYTDQPEGLTGIDKRPVDGRVRVAAPGPKGTGASGVAGDAVCDLRHHGGDDQAVYAVAREDLDGWERELGRSLPNGSFGENLTTEGLDVSGARIGERWRIGPEVVLEVTSGRIPCRTFQGHLGERGWVKRFTRKGAPGAYLRVIEPGEVQAGDPITIVHRPDHEVTVALQFRATTTERHLLPLLLAAGDALHPEGAAKAREYTRKHLA
ncbi:MULTISPECIES: MOSC domain-containing protein [Streptomyces]|uniref:MOSC domain-containing protein n=1 Tax=Streptomyces nodosus TaxID=40318 RepID=A0A0B5DEF4_9ACTN|nr:MULTISPECIES: MOSC domain-containing protein [Streptomyces]AJE42068.1 sulfurase [Streptomyces nodosus]MBB4793324.1 MOSC domain-containing protein YiiM [Streptomyces nodosus]MYV45358.1 MOSC domain-containing protein [Streptomyces sp. SID2888]QEV40591.1 MOSC domain-containing protein [Streptomyces nodosus]